MGCDREYWPAPPCPYCGQKDDGTYKGARMGNSSWKHTYMCCSEECGVKFYHSPQHKALEIKKLESLIEGLKEELEHVKGW